MDIKVIILLYILHINNEFTVMDICNFIEQNEIPYLVSERETAIRRAIRILIRDEILIKTNNKTYKIKYKNYV
jgi:hypothetical protein